MKEHQNCIVCGSENRDSLGLTFSKNSDDSVSAKFYIGRRLQGYNNILHGGVISSLLDSAMVHSLEASGIIGVTAELNVRFYQEIPVDREIVVKGWLVDSRMGIYRLKSEIVLDGRIVAKGSGKFMKRGG